jgi:CheY-like chemotaxis protein
VHTRFQHVPFILITADADDELRSEAEQEPIFSVLSKPVRKLELVDTVSLAFETAYADHHVRSLLMN